MEDNNIFEIIEDNVNKDKTKSKTEIKNNKITAKEIIHIYYPLIDFDSKNLYYNLRSYSSTSRKISDYGKEKNIIAIYKDSLGAVFIMKSPRTYFAFTLIHNILGRGYDHRLFERDLIEVIKFIDSSSNSEILDPEEYDKLKKIMMVKKLHGK